MKDNHSHRPQETSPDKRYMSAHADDLVCAKLIRSCAQPVCFPSQLWKPERLGQGHQSRPHVVGPRRARWRWDGRMPARAGAPLCSRDSRLARSCRGSATVEPGGSARRHEGQRKCAHTPGFLAAAAQILAPLFMLSCIAARAHILAPCWGVGGPPQGRCGMVVCEWSWRFVARKHVLHPTM